MLLKGYLALNRSQRILSISTTIRTLKLNFVLISWITDDLISYQQESDDMFRTTRCRVARQGA